MAEKSFKLVCSRCNRIRTDATKCDDQLICAATEYFNTYSMRFRFAPPKYYCSLTGGIGAGKTYYILALVDSILNKSKEIKKFFAKVGIADIEVIDPISLDLFSDLVQLAKLGKHGFTQVNTPLGFVNLIITTTEGKVYELVLFNTSGEKIEDELMLRKFMTNSHELKGNAIIHFIDPREDKDLNKLLNVPKDKAQVTNHDIPNHEYSVLKNFKMGATKVNTPFAVCISKFDLMLPKIPDLITDHPYVEAENMNVFFEEIDRVSSNLVKFLDEKSAIIDPDDLEAKFTALKYFAVAPFGSDEEAYWDNRNPRGIHAPFIWILKNLKII